MYVKKIHSMDKDKAEKEDMEFREVTIVMG